MKKIFILSLSLLSLYIYSCSDNTSSSTSTTKDSFLVSTVNDTTTINFEISGLTISDTRSRDINNAAVRFSTSLKIESVTNGGFTFSTFRDNVLCSTIQVKKAIDTTGYYVGKLNKFSFIPDNFSGKGIIVIRGHD